MLALALCLLVGADAPRSLDPQVKITLFADAPQIVTPTGIAVDSKGRVLCIESHTHFRPEGYQGPPADRIRRFEDTDGDGRADKIETVYEGSKHTMALAFAPDGRLVVATRAEVFALTLGEDGKSGPKTTLVRLDTPGNYPHNGLSGVTFDYDGTLYFGLGENLGADYKLIGSDGETLKGGGEGGNIYRCKPDGSKLEKVATGFWNPFAMTFDAFGRLFAVDNDPDSRPPCRLLHIVDGGDYGYRFRNGRKGLHPFTSWNGELPGTLPMVAGTGEAPSGIVAYEAVEFPGYRGDLLVTSWGDHRIDRFQIHRTGDLSTLTASVSPMVTGGEDFRPVGIIVALDGSIYVSDWVNKSYDLHGKGKIWRLSATSDSKLVIGKGVRHPDRRIREAAMKDLAKSGADGQKALLSLIDNPTGREPFQPGANGPPLRYPGETESELGRIQISAIHAARLAGATDESVLKAARGQSDEVQVEAMRCGKRGVADSNASRIVFDQMLRVGAKGVGFPSAGLQGDPFHEQATREYLKHATTLAERIELFRKPREPVQRLQVLLTLRDSGDLAARVVLDEALASNDPYIRLVAVMWVAEQGLKEYRDRLMASLADGALTPAMFEATLAAIGRLDGGRREANDDTGAESLVARLVVDPKTPNAVRRRALRVLRPDHPALTAKVFDELLATTDLPLRIEAVRSLRESSLADRTAKLLQVTSDPKQPEEIRAEAVAGLPATSDSEREFLWDLKMSDDRMVSKQAGRSVDGLPLPKKYESRFAARTGASGSFEPTPLHFDRSVLPLPTGLTPPVLADKLADLATRPDDADEGQRIFFHPKGPGCYKCHRVEGRGGRVGPDLTATGPATTREKLIRSIVEPDAEIAPQFTTWRLARHDGTQLDGVLVEEAVNGDQTYADAEGKRVTVKAADVAERKPLTTSVMPRDLLAKLSPREVRDLIAFIHREPPAEDNVLTPEQKEAGWQLLFDGKTLNGWTTEKKAAGKVPVQDGAINPHGAGGYMMIHEKEWGDFVLSLDFKISEKCHSGVFIRTSPLEPRPGKDVGFNGIEIAIDDTKEAGFHDTGAIYDLVKPTHNAMKPVGEWNHMEITCDGPKISVSLNGQIVTETDLDQWTEKNKRPDGTPHKFDIAYKDHPRKGYIGLQDHGSNCWYKNIKIRELKK